MMRQVTHTWVAWWPETVLESPRFDPFFDPERPSNRPHREMARCNNSLAVARQCTKVTRMAGLGEIRGEARKIAGNSETGREFPNSMSR
jgi:hypothetical protein